MVLPVVVNISHRCIPRVDGQSRSHMFGCTGSNLTYLLPSFHRFSTCSDIFPLLPIGIPHYIVDNTSHSFFIMTVPREAFLTPASKVGELLLPQSQMPIHAHWRIVWLNVCTLSRPPMQSRIHFLSMFRTSSKGPFITSEVDRAHLSLTPLPGK